MTRTPSIQVLLSCMHQTDHSILDRMNIQTDAIVVNQCDRNEIENFEYKGHKILWMSLKEKGVSLSRNTALMRSTADILVIADDDVRYDDGYSTRIVEKFKQYPQADILIWNLKRSYETLSVDQKEQKCHFFNVLAYGTARLVLKRKSIMKHNICFHPLLGPGTQYSHGEDSAFLIDSLKNHLTVWKIKDTIGELERRKKSTWFDGYTKIYWFNKGVAFRYLFGAWGYPLGIAIVCKNYNQTKEIGIWNALKSILQGVHHGLS